MKSKDLLFNWLFLPGIIFFSVFCHSCRQKNKVYEPSFSTDTSLNKILLFGVSTQSYYETTDLFVDYVKQHLNGVQLKTVSSSNFSNYIGKLDARDFHMCMANGIQALEVPENGYSILCTAVDEVSYAGAILIHKDSSINGFADLKGKTVASPGYPALAGHVLQMVYLSKKGLNVNKDIRFNYLESFESVILNVYLGKCAAAFSSTNGWRLFLKQRPEIASKVALKWTTTAVPGVAFLLRNDVEKGIASQLKNILLNMHLNERGKKALAKLGYLRFEAADSNSFQPIKDVLEEYEAFVGDTKL